MTRKPEAGDILSYRYLWHREYEKGLEEGSKARPSVVLTLIEKNENNVLEVYLLPITHSQPENPNDAYLIPSDKALKAGLDESKNFVNLTEMNHFTWKGYDVESVPNSNPKTEYYGRLDFDITNKLRSELAARKARGSFTIVQRDGV